MSNEMMLLNTNSPLSLPAHLQGQNLGVTAGILATMGAGGNRIGLKGSRFRIVVNGKEEAVRDENYLDCIIVGVLPYISRMYYEGEYDQSGQTKSKPTCFSEAGDAPPLDLPTRQSDKCDTCQWNVKGSKVVGNMKMKACGFFQRLVIMLPGDPDRRVFKLDVRSQGIFGDSHPSSNKFNIREYGKLLGNRGIDACTVITRLSFDTESSVPKLLFSPTGFVDAGDFEAVKEAVGSEEVKNLLRITMATVDLSEEESRDDTARAVEAVTPAAPVQAAPAPPAPAEEPEKKRYRPVPEKLGDFSVQQYLDSGWTKEALIEQGMIEEIPEPPAPAPAPPPAPKPPPAPAAPPPPPPAPKPPPAPTQTPPAPPPAAAPVKASGAVQVETIPIPGTAKAAAPVKEVATDAELQDLINDLL